MDVKRLPARTLGVGLFFSRCPHLQLDGGVCVVFGHGPCFLCASVDGHWTVTGVPAEHGGVTGGVIIVLELRWITS